MQIMCNDDYDPSEALINKTTNNEENELPSSDEVYQQDDPSNFKTIKTGINADDAPAFGYQ